MEGVIYNAAASAAASGFADVVARNVAERAVATEPTRRGYRMKGVLSKKRYYKVRKYQAGKSKGKKRIVRKKVKKMKRTKRVGKRTYKKRTKKVLSLAACAKLGGTHQYNISGEITGTTAVHFGYCSYPKRELLRIVVQALLRKLFKDGLNYEVKSAREILRLNGGYGGTNVDSNQYVVEVIYRDRTGAINPVVPIAIDTNANNTLQTLADAVSDEFYRYSSNNVSGTASTDYSTYVLDFLRLTEYDGTYNSTWTNFRTRGIVDLNAINVHFTCQTMCKWQNATNPNATGTASSDDVNALPLLGNELHFGSYVPLLVDSVNALQFQQSIPWETPILKKNESSVGTGELYNTLDKKDFRNCKKMIPCSVNPGNFMLHGVNTSHTKSFPNFLKWIKLPSNDTTSGFKPDPSSGGKFFMWSMRKALNGSATIRLLYNVDYEVGAYVSQKRNTAQLTTYTYAQY